MSLIFELNFWAQISSSNFELNFLSSNFKLNFRAQILRSNFWAQFSSSNFELNFQAQIFYFIFQLKILAQNLILKIELKFKLKYSISNWEKICLNLAQISRIYLELKLRKNGLHFEIKICNWNCNLTFLLKFQAKIFSTNLKKNA